MARRILAREVLRLRSSNLSLNAIAAALHESKAGVTVVLRAAAEHDVAWEEAVLSTTEMAAVRRMLESRAAELDGTWTRH